MKSSVDHLFFGTSHDTQVKFTYVNFTKIKFLAEHDFFKLRSHGNFANEFSGLTMIFLNFARHLK